MAGPLNALLVCGGKFHDIDYARKELLGLLYEHREVQTTVTSDYSDTRALAKADFLVTYTCDVAVNEEEQKALSDFVASGKRWLALHGTNSVFEFVEKGVGAPRTHPVLMETLGSQFIAHPPIQPYTVTVCESAKQHPLVAGIEPFEVEDEIYLCEYHGKIEPLLETRFTGAAPGFVEDEWNEDEPRLVMYLHPHDKGQVLYLTLGHCRGKYDMRPIMDEYPVVERGAWESPAFHELLGRGLRWVIGEEV